MGDAPMRGPEAGREKRLVAISSVAAGVLLTSLKLGVGLLTGSLGILAEALHSALDLGAALITLFAVRLSDKPMDEEHLYGHGRVENLSALAETLLLLITCAWIIYEAIVRIFFKAVEIEASLWAFLIMFISIAVDYNRSRALSRAAKKYHSQALEADALHFHTDIWSSSVVILGLIFVRVGESIGRKSIFQRADAVAALGVAGIVLWVSLQLGRRSIDVLMDRAPAGLRRRMEEVARGVEGVVDCQQVRARRSGPAILGDLTISVERGLPLEKAHAIAEEVERRLVREIPGLREVVVHMQPRTMGKGVGVVGRILAIAEGLNCQVHEIRAHEIEGQLWVDLHMEVEDSLSLGEAHRLATLLEERIQETLENVARVYVHIEPLEAVTQEVETAEGDYRIESEVKRLVEGMEDIKECHKVRVRRFEGRVFVSLHCVLDGEPAVAEAHDISTRLERTIGEGLKGVDQVLVHLEPPDLKAKGG